MNKGMVYKLLALGVMALILQIALNQVQGKIQERQTTRDSVVAGIAHQYAGAQQVAGPLLYLSCTETRSVARLDESRQPRLETETRDCSRLIQPEHLTGQGALDVSERYRGIYKARVYVADLRLLAEFAPVSPDLKPNQTLNGAYWVFPITDPRGLRSLRVENAQGQVLQAQPGTLDASLPGGFHVAIPLDSLGQAHSVSLKLSLKGSDGFEWVPVARDNAFSLNAAWPHPSFTGLYLPDDRSVDAQGFNANWHVNAFATGGASALTRGPTNDSEQGMTGPTRFTQGLGVSLIDPVDAYVQSDRAVRYGFMFVLLTLGGFYLFELLKRKTLHPLQYLMIGFAVVVFFLLLIALSEQVGFLMAYIIAASACTLLIGTYGKTLLGNWAGSAGLILGYAGLYGGLYQLLASEDQALLLGAWLVFGVLAATMYFTRRLDWQGVGQTTPVQTVAPAPTK